MGAATACSFCNSDNVELRHSSRTAAAICDGCATYGAQMKLERVPPMSDVRERIHAQMRLVCAKKAYVIRAHLDGRSKLSAGPGGNAFIDATVCSFCGEPARRSPIALAGTNAAVCVRCAETLLERAH